VGVLGMRLSVTMVCGGWYFGWVLQQGCVSMHNVVGASAALTARHGRLNSPLASALCSVLSKDPSVLSALPFQRKHPRAGAGHI
jgi:hypothetical protein